MKLLETQIARVEANEGMAVMLACRNRRVTMSKLIDPVVDLARFTQRIVYTTAADFSFSMDVLIRCNKSVG